MKKAKTLTVEQLEGTVQQQVSEIAEALRSSPPAPDWAIKVLQKSLELHKKPKELSAAEAIIYFLHLLHHELPASDILEGIEKDRVQVRGATPLAALKVIKEMELAGLIKSREIETAGRRVPAYSISSTGRDYLIRHAESKELAQVKALGLLPIQSTL